MNKTQIVMILFCAILPNVAISSTNQPAVCSANDKFVVRFSKPPSSQAKLCERGSYEADGDNCESEYAREYWIYEYIGDLNNDQIPDAIVSNFAGGIWNGVKSYLVLIGCSDGSYARVFDDALASLAPSKNSDKSGWIRLNATRQYPINGIENGGDYHSFNSQKLKLFFDQKIQKYVTTDEGKILPMKGDDDAAVVDSKINIPTEVIFIWDEFPRANLPEAQSPPPVQRNP
jgi:hypothetical protein